MRKHTDETLYPVTGHDGRQGHYSPQLGRVIWRIAGGSTMPPEPGPTPPVPTPPAPPAPTPPTPGGPAGSFTQEQVNAIAAKEKADGKRAAETEVAALLGCTPAEAKAILDKHNEAERNKMTEAEKAQADAAAAKAAAEETQRQANELLHSAKVATALFTAGVPLAQAGDVAKLVDAPVGADDATIAAAITATKTAFPALFTGTPAPTPPAPSSVPGGAPPAPAVPGNSMAELRKAAREKRGLKSA